MGYRLNRLDEPVFMAGPKPMLTEFGIHHRLESCVSVFMWLKKLSFFCILKLGIFSFFCGIHNSPIYDECQTQSAWVLALP